MTNKCDRKTHWFTVKRWWPSGDSLVFDHSVPFVLALTHLLLFQFVLVLLINVTEQIWL